MPRFELFSHRRCNFYGYPFDTQPGEVTVSKSRTEPQMRLCLLSVGAPSYWEKSISLFVTYATPFVAVERLYTDGPEGEGQPLISQG